MDSKQSLSKSATNSIDTVISPDGYSLKKYSLKKWIYENDHTQPYVARKLGLAPEDFKRKLREREKFNRAQIWELIKLMGAEDAFKVLYFPSKRQRRKVWWQVFGKYRDKEKLNERKDKIKRQEQSDTRNAHGREQGYKLLPFRGAEFAY